MKIYSGRGDNGWTELLGGYRIEKDDPLLEVIGTLDELNSSTGLLIAYVKDEATVSLLKGIQENLAHVMSILAGKTDKPGKRDESIQQIIEQAEHSIDDLEKNLKPLKHLLLPGGSPGSAQAHICRTVCRRAERRFVSLGKTSDISPRLKAYLNRLGDLYFIIARHLDENTGE